MLLSVNSRLGDLAFVSALPRPSCLFARSSSFVTSHRLALPRLSSRPLPVLTMTAGNTEETVSTTPPVSITDATNTEYSLDTEVLKEKAMQVVSDVSERPLFYTQIFAYSAAALVALTVLRAVISAIDSIPILPGILELIGLSYTVWFFWRYVLFKESRQELLEEVEEFLGRARPQ